jgi:hypothetical protein
LQAEFVRSAQAGNTSMSQSSEQQQDLPTELLILREQVRTLISTSLLMDHNSKILNLYKLGAKKTSATEVPFRLDFRVQHS